tara:strand:- start:4805 stop:5026 length:222 start_codon:yes stop_codon:yes gene_type:complete
MIEAKDIAKASEIIKDEIQAYRKQGLSEISTCRYLSYKYDCYWQALQKLSNNKIQSCKKAAEVSQKILENQND